MITNYYDLARTAEEYFGGGFKTAKTMVESSRYYKETRSLLNTLIKHGFKLIMVDDSEEFVTVSNRDEAAVVMCGVDECQLLVKNKEGKEKWIVIVYGNSPGEMVCDYHVDPDLDTATDEHYNRWFK